MRILLAVVLVGIAGCGGDNSPDDVAVSTPKTSQAKTDKSPAQTPDVDPVAALKKIGAKIKRDDQGEVVEVSLAGTKITDAELVHLKGLANLQSLTLTRTEITDSGLVHFKGLPNLQTLYLSGTKVTDTGLVHLKGMTNLEKLILYDAKVTDAGVADLQKALPNCKITK